MRLRKVVLISFILTFFVGLQIFISTTATADTKSKIKTGKYKLVNTNKLCFDWAFIERSPDQSKNKFLVSFGREEMKSGHSGDYRFNCVEESCRGKGDEFEIRTIGSNTFSTNHRHKCIYRLD